MSEHNAALAAEEERIRAVYAERKRAGKSDLYAWHRPDVLLERCGFRRTAAALLTAYGPWDWSAVEVLDVGCGGGAHLRMFNGWGALPERLHGVDLLEDRIAAAARFLPGADLRVVSGGRLPYPEASMDLVVAAVVFSSILDLEARAALAAEMLRVAKPDGTLLIYDFRISHPRNPDTVGIGRTEIKRLFPRTTTRARSLTLAPPLARRLAPVSAAAALLLERLCPLLRTHLMYLLTKEESAAKKGAK